MVDYSNSMGVYRMDVTPQNYWLAYTAPYRHITIAWYTLLAMVAWGLSRGIKPVTLGMEPDALVHSATSLADHYYFAYI